VSGPLLLLGVAFALAGVGIGCAETAEHAAVAAAAPTEIRGSAFGLLATVQAVGNLAASAIAGLLYTFASPAVAFGLAARRAGIALAVLRRLLAQVSPVWASLSIAAVADQVGAAQPVRRSATRIKSRASQQSRTWARMRGSIRWNTGRSRSCRRRRQTSGSATRGEW
jgi:MFS family permease